MKLNHFKNIQFLPAIKALFNELKVPMNYVADEPTTAEEILKDTYKDNETFKLINDVYFVGMIDDAAFDGNQSLNSNQIKSDYDGILIFGITLQSRKNNLFPTRSQLAEISRAFNREFYYTPVVIVYKYQDETANYIAFANTERLQYKQVWREGEKAGKVSLLRDINIEKPHRGHEDIINQLKIPTAGKKQVDSFAKLYSYWQEVFNVNLLNKKFYQELSNWYFWALKHVTFPNKPTIEDAHLKNVELNDLIQEHNAKNVIRLLTRLLFTWFIKEKKLIPNELFDLDVLHKDILKKISPDRVGGLFEEANLDSIYYKAILQNLFFATLNCPIKADGIDNRHRGFRGLETYGKHRGIDWMMRYEGYFKNPEMFLEMMNKTVPFLNGGLFECLDDKTQNLYIDGFSDQMTKGENLIVPDYLFFGVEEKVDLSEELGIKNKGTKEAAVKGLINILKSYKFTITENTPIEEDVALDPELLGKVFENLLASYNPETKTTARKQTGSFYTPREIVNYMVDESLIAYLKNVILKEEEVYQEFGESQTNLLGNEAKSRQLGLTDKVGKSKYHGSEDELDNDLHQLFSFDNKNPFESTPELQKQIINALDKCTILDPACGSGAFPMGVLQKMVHVLHKIDPKGQEWKQRQIDKVNNAIERLEEIEDNEVRDKSIKDLELQKIDIEDAFENNDLDYGRKLFLIENCIYGVDIQSIATQISKLRFFISLVVDQKINPEKENFGIRPLPNLETKFVAANTLIGIEKPTAQTNLFDTKEVRALERELKKIRHKLFSAKTKDTKLKYRKKDEELRKAIAEELKALKWDKDSANQLAKWDPYDQNASSPFFDPEWMFDISEGFDVVIGNPPYKILTKNTTDPILLKSFIENYYSIKTASSKNLYTLFIEQGIKLLSDKSQLAYIVPEGLYQTRSYKDCVKFMEENGSTTKVVTFSDYVFENAVTGNLIFLYENSKSLARQNFHFDNSYNLSKVEVLERPEISAIEEDTITLKSISTCFKGMVVKDRKTVISEKEDVDRFLLGKNISKWRIESWLYTNYNNLVIVGGTKKLEKHRQNPRILVRRTGETLCCAYLDCPSLTESTLYSVWSTDKRISNRFLYGLLNSRLLDYYNKVKNITNQQGFPQILMTDLQELPIKIPSKDLKVAVEFLVNVISHQNDSLWEKVLNALIFNLYFYHHLVEREIDVLEFVKQDMNQTLKGLDFNRLSDSEKEKVIEQLHAIWSHPDNEVRNRIKLFAIRSPEILKPILES